KSALRSRAVRLRSDDAKEILPREGRGASVLCSSGSLEERRITRSLLIGRDNSTKQSPHGVMQSNRANALWRAHLRALSVTGFRVHRERPDEFRADSLIRVY